MRGIEKREGERVGQRQKPYKRQSGREGKLNKREGQGQEIEWAGSWIKARGLGREQERRGGGAR